MTTDPRATTAPGSAGTLDPEFARRVLALGGLAPYGPGERTPAEAARIAAFHAPYGPVDLPPCRTLDVAAPGPHGPVPVRVYLPVREGEKELGAGPALVWLHGGAFMGGDLDTVEADHSSRFVAGTSGRPVVSVDYRLARGGLHHPVPEDDCVAAYRWVRDSGAVPGVDPARIAVGGASAGGCLAASVGLRLRDEGAVPWRLFMIYPVAHARPVAVGPELAACLAQLPEGLRITRSVQDAVNANYLGGDLEAAGPYAFPGEGHDLRGLPPVYLENCEFDDLRASGEEFARQLREADVQVETVCVAGVPHAHLSWAGSGHAYATLRRISARLA